MYRVSRQMLALVAFVEYAEHLEIFFTTAVAHWLLNGKIHFGGTERTEAVRLSLSGADLDFWLNFVLK